MTYDQKLMEMEGQMHCLVGYIRSHSNARVKQQSPRRVLGWETTWELLCCWHGFDYWFCLEASGQFRICTTPNRWNRIQLLLLVLHFHFLKLTLQQKKWTQLKKERYKKSTFINFCSRWIICFSLNYLAPVKWKNCRWQAWLPSVAWLTSEQGCHPRPGCHR